MSTSWKQAWTEAEQASHVIESDAERAYLFLRLAKSALWDADHSMGHLSNAALGKLNAIFEAVSRLVTRMEKWEEQYGDADADEDDES